MPHPNTCPFGDADFAADVQAEELMPSPSSAVGAGIGESRLRSSVRKAGALFPSKAKVAFSHSWRVEGEGRIAHKTIATPCGILRRAHLPGDSGGSWNLLAKGEEKPGLFSGYTCPLPLSHSPCQLP